MMAPRSFVASCLVAITGAAAAASAQSYTGVYESWGRACHGAVSLRSKTIEWKSQLNDCERSPYEVLDVAPSDQPPRIAVRITKRSKNCFSEVVELKEEQNDMKIWSLTGYPSLEAYQKRELPEWRDSTAVDRMALSCPLDPRNDPRH
jgi:hypothetical protein